MIGNEIFYLSILLLSLYIISIILSFFILKVFIKKIKNLTLKNIIFIFGIIFFEIFYHEKIRDLIVNNSNLDTINAFILSLIIIFFINFLKIIILIKYFNKIKINIFIFMVLLVIVTHLNNFNLYKSKIQNDEELTFFKKSDLPKKKLNENIYLIILDEMTNLNDFVNQFPKEKNNIKTFREKLELKKFIILENSLAAYNLTYLNLTALINANYFINENSPKYVSRNSFFQIQFFIKQEIQFKC